MCKKTIESNLLSAKGVNSAVVDMINFKTVIQYDSNMVSLKELELVIAKSGYQANEVKADSIAYKNIPMCCRLAKDRSE
jgi:copper chaperone CopZ